MLPRKDVSSPDVESMESTDILQGSQMFLGLFLVLPGVLGCGFFQVSNSLLSFFSAVLGLRCHTRAFSSCGKQGLLSSCGCGLIVLLWIQTGCVTLGGPFSLSRPPVLPLDTL